MISNTAPIPSSKDIKKESKRGGGTLSQLKIEIKIMCDNVFIFKLNQIVYITELKIMIGIIHK